MLAQRLIECAAGFVLERSIAHLRDGSRPGKRRGTWLGQVIEHMGEIAFAAFVGGPIPFDEPPAAGNLQAEFRVLA